VFNFNTKKIELTGPLADALTALIIEIVREKQINAVYHNIALTEQELKFSLPIPEDIFNAS
jgi:hypothetical protein